MLDLPKTYEARTHELDVYRRWEAGGCFRAGAGSRPGAKAYAIVIPPPNVTGVLHMGHALNNTLQDTLVRWRRMQGHDVLWQPGTDHAGIATESVVAKQLLAEQSSREALGREAFIQRVWRWKEESGGTIIRQLRRLGASCDWSRERFTMDEGLSRAVREMFCRLYKAGLIYRGERMVNWSVALGTALSDDEVDVRDIQGAMYRLVYPLSNGGGSIEVETTRPETFFGDTAVAVHPDDPRYQALIGQRLRLPLVGREIPVIADTYADPAKGTGAVKITPAHDPNDFAIGQRHGLALVRVIGTDGRMTAEAGAYQGQERFACRKALVKALTASGVLIKTTPITHAVGHSERTGEPIEPMVCHQWFVRMAPLAERALAETEAGRVRFHPARWGKVYGQWLHEVRDWCISRQIWWGHRIPAWTDADTGEVVVQVEDPTRDGAHAGRRLVQDPDVLDTWFSSALWPMSTLGWPEETPELARYYPTSTLVTDRGIIYFWVARMVMAGLFVRNVRPFDDVYIHGTVLDERGEKMSKSLGNGIDPIIMIEGGTQRYLGKDIDCPGYGADAVRYTLLDMTTEGQDLKLSPIRFETGRNFANKVWNAGRFLLMNLGVHPLPHPPTPQELLARDLGLPERWILDRLQETIAACEEALERFRYNDYANAAYRFFRDDLCDWYLEWVKHQFRTGMPGDGPQTAPGSGEAIPAPGPLPPPSPTATTSAMVLYHAFDQVLRLLHPGMPFLSELLWQHLQGTSGGTPWQEGRFLTLGPWPVVESALRHPASGVRMARLQSVVQAVRTVRNRQNLPDSAELAVTIATPDEASATALEEDRIFIADRARCSQVAISPGAVRPPASVTEVVGELKVHVSLAGHIDLERMRSQLGKQLQEKESSVAGRRKRLENPDYVARAPAAQVEQTRALLAQEVIEIAHLKEALSGL